MTRRDRVDAKISTCLGYGKALLLFYRPADQSPRSGQPIEQQKAIKEPVLSTGTDVQRSPTSVFVFPPDIIRRRRQREVGWPLPAGAEEALCCLAREAPPTPPALQANPYVCCFRGC